MHTCFVGQEAEVSWVELRGLVVAGQGCGKVPLLVGSVASLLGLQSLCRESPIDGQPKIEAISAKKDIIGKGISRGAEWFKFQLLSTFQ